MVGKDSPILIASPARSGTTMLAWLLHLHGVWIGQGGVTQSPETNPQVPTENRQIKQYLRSARGVPADFRRRIVGMVHASGPWLVKTASNLLCWKAWNQHFPEARWLLPVRPFDDIMASRKRHPGLQRYDDEGHRRIVAHHKQLQDAVREVVSHWRDVDMDALCGGESNEEARAAIEFCGLKFDQQMYRGWVQPERWHGNGTER